MAIPKKKKPIMVKVLGPNGKWLTARDESALAATAKALHKKAAAVSRRKS